MTATNLRCPGSTRYDPVFAPKCSRILYRYPIIDLCRAPVLGYRGKHEYLRRSLNGGYWRVGAQTSTTPGMHLVVALLDGVRLLNPRAPRCKSVGSKFANAGDPVIVTDAADPAYAYDD